MCGEQSCFAFAVKLLNGKNITELPTMDFKEYNALKFQIAKMTSLIKLK
ncbi:MAG: hypothetical protein QXQ41_00525 [Candidatus Bathyarchaeia archaeon]